MPRLEYFDFDLQIEHAPDGYRIEVDSPAGHVISRFQLPFSDLELENFLLKIGRPRRSDVRRVDLPEVETVKAFGGRLFDSLFDAEVRGALRSSLDEATRQGKGLRIRLGLTNAPELVDVPWEYLYIRNLNRFLALSGRTPLVRDLELPERLRPLQVDPPLRVLVLIASPSDAPPLDVEREWMRLREALSDLEQRGLIKLDRLDVATFAGLQRRLRRRSYHILHFIGHGAFDSSRQDGVLLLEDEERRSHQVSGQELGILLHDHDTLRLVILNSCEGARGARSDPFAGTAQSLVQQSVPAVIAMQFEISDNAAIAMAQGFYSALADGYPVDAALVDARRAIFAQSGGIEWGTPVLYLRARDGSIFDVAPPPITQPMPVMQPSTPSAITPTAKPVAAVPAATTPGSTPVAAVPAAPADSLLEALLGQATSPPAASTSVTPTSAKLASSPLRTTTLPPEARTPASKGTLPSIQDGARRALGPPWLRSAGLGVGALALVLLAALAMRSLLGSGRDPGPTAQLEPSPGLLANLSPSSAPTPSPLPTVLPVGDDEYMILVGQLEQSAGASGSNRAHELAVALEQQLGEQTIPFSRLRIREYPAVIDSPAKAQAASRASGATVVVWGRQSNGTINLNVQLGADSRKRFGHIPERLGDQVLARTAGVELSLSDPQRESIAQPVLAAVNVLHTADGDGFETLRTVATNQELNELLKRNQVTPARVVSSGVGSNLHRFLSTYFDDAQSAVVAMDEALSRDDGNPLLYLYRATAYRRLAGETAASDLEAAQQFSARSREDVNTAQRLGGDSWLSPAYLRAFNEFDTQQFEVAVAILNQIIEQRPDDWFPYSFRAAIYFLSGRPELARIDLQRSQEKNPSATFIDGFGALIALREGNLADARTQMRRVIESGDSPTFGGRVMDAMLGQSGVAFGAILRSLSQLGLGRYGEVIANVDQALAINPQAGQLPGLQLVRGIAACNMQDYATAEAAYSRGLELDSGFTLLYLLRSEARQRQGNVQGAFEDYSVAQQSPSWPLLAQSLGAAPASCTQLLAQ